MEKNSKGKKDKKPKESFFDYIKLLFTYVHLKFKNEILIPVLEKFLEIGEKLENKKAQNADKMPSKKEKSPKKKKEPKTKEKKSKPKKESRKKAVEEYVTTNRQSINPRYEQNDTPVAKAPYSIGDFKNKIITKKPREILSKRERRERWQRRKKALGKFSLRAGAIAIVLGLVFLCGFQYYSTMISSDVEESAKQFIEGKEKGKGYPYAINSIDVIDMQAMGSNLAVLTQENLLVLNSSAKEVVRYLHGFSDPQMFVYANRVLIYDRATGKYRVLNSSKILLKGELETEIFNAVMNKEGTIAFSVKDEKNPGKILVVSPNGKEKYSYAIKEEQIFDMDLSPNSNSLAVVSIGVNEAQLYSNVTVHNLKTKQVGKKHSFTSTILDVIYPASKKVITIGSDAKSTIDKKQACTKDYDYPEASLDFYDKADSGRCVLVLSEHGSEGSHKIVQFDSKSKLQSEITVDEKIHAISCSNKYVSVLYENKAVLLDSKGDVKKEFEANKNGKRIVNVGNDVYILYSSNIEKSS